MFCIIINSFIINIEAYELAIGSMFKNEAPYLKEWVEYHLAAGVEHFWLYNDFSSDNWEEILQPYIDQGIVEVIYWPTPIGSSWVINQINAFRAAISRAKGATKWIALIDIDEFIVPMQDSSIPECLEKHFADAPAVYVNWRSFGTAGVTIPQGKPILFELTAASLPHHPYNAVGKSIVKPEAVEISWIWYPHHFPLSKGAQYLNGNRKEMQFRGIDLPTDGKHYDKFIRINHYELRDEGFYKNSRLKKAEQGNGNLKLLQEHYISFSKTHDFAIINFIKNNFSMDSQALWKEN